MIEALLVAVVFFFACGSFPSIATWPLRLGLSLACLSLALLDKSGWFTGAFAATLVVVGKEASTRKEARRTLIWLIPVMAAVWAVGALSGDSGGADPMLAWLKTGLGLTQQVAEASVLVIRKAIHLTFYGTVAWLVFKAGLASLASIKSSVVAASAFALSLAAFDEFRQTQSAIRTGSLADVLLDTLGIAFFLWIGCHKATSAAGQPSPA